jgi:hypothetical protein
MRVFAMLKKDEGDEIVCVLVDVLRREVGGRRVAMKVGEDGLRGDGL